MGEDKPSFTLLPAAKVALQEVLELFRHLTGRDPTPEEEVEVAKMLEEEQARGDNVRADDARP
jgi:hypothetical protein